MTIHPSDHYKATGKPESYHDYIIEERRKTHKDPLKYHNSFMNHVYGLKSGKISSSSSITGL